MTTDPTAVDLRHVSGLIKDGKRHAAIKVFVAGLGPEDAQSFQTLADLRCLIACGSRSPSVGP
jgi:hypothetical protein